MLEEASTEMVETEEVEVVKKVTLDQFWKLGQAKNEKNRLEAASKVLQTVAKSELDVGYAITRLVKGLAGSTNESRQGYFVCLTELMRQSEVGFKKVAKQVAANLKIGGTLSKGEEADFLVAQLLAYTAMLRAGVVEGEDREEVVKELLEISGTRNYLMLPVIKVLVENFLGKGDTGMITIIINAISVKVADLNIDSLFLLLSIYRLDQDMITEDFLTQVGVKKMFGKKALQIFSTCLLTANLPPAVVAQHPSFPLLVSLLVEKEAMTKFWQMLGPEMTAANSKGVVGWSILKEVGRLAGGAKLLPDMLSRHTLSVGIQLASRQASVGLVKDVLSMVVVMGVDSEGDRMAMIKKLLDMDLCWDKLPLGGNVSQLLAKAEVDTVKEVGKVFMTSLAGEGKMPERVHSAAMLVKMVGLPGMQGELEWRGEVLQSLASVSVVMGVVGVGSLNSNGRDQMKDVLFRALDSRNKTLEDSVVLLIGVVKNIKNQMSKGVTRVRSVTDEQERVSKKAMGIIDKLEKKWSKGNDKEAAVFLFLYCQMWLQMFSQPDLATEVLGELAPVHERWSRGDKKGQEEGEEPAWVEVVTEILISLLAQNNHLLRGVVGAVFSVVGKEMTRPAIDSLLAVVRQKEGDEAEDEDDDDDDDEDGVRADGDVDIKDSNDNEENSDDSSDSEEEEEDEDDDKEVNQTLLNKISGALGEHAAVSDDDIDMDDVPDEDMAKLDQKLVEAFKVLGGRKDGLAKKKAALSSLASMHFKLRVLEVVELYLKNTPNPALLPSMIPSLLEALDTAVRSSSKEETLVKRLVSVLAKFAGVAMKMKVEDKTLSIQLGKEVVQVLTSLLELASSGSVIIATLGPTYPRLATSLLRLGEQCEQMEQLESLYTTSLSTWLHQSNCVLPNDVFSLAMSHSWPGCWSLATTLATSAFSTDVRQYRRVASLSFLLKLLQKKNLIQDNLEQVKKVVELLMPALTQELDKLKDMLGKVKPKYLSELMSLLTALKNLPSESLIDWDTQVQKLQVLSKIWPANKIYQGPRKALMVFGGKCGVKFEVEVLQKGDVKASNGIEVEEAPVKIKKKKNRKRTQEYLKNAKEMKYKMSEAHDVAGVPSFAAMVEDNLNDSDSTGPSKRKIDAEDTETPVKVKKAKKKKDETETPKIKKSKKKKPQE